MVWVGVFAQIVDDFVKTKIWLKSTAIRWIKIISNIIGSRNDTVVFLQSNLTKENFHPDVDSLDDWINPNNIFLNTKNCRKMFKI